MILAGDIGGTKTVLALYRPEDPIGQPFRTRQYPSRDYPSLDPIVASFLGPMGETPRAAAFGIAGPVVARRVETTNLPWLVDADQMEERFGIRRVDLLNDLQATATAVPFLPAGDSYRLHPGHADPEGVIAVIAPGTGLGMAFLIPNDRGYRAFPAEGGHMSFAPGSSLEGELLDYLRERFGHVSYERIASGSGLPNIYEFLRQARHHQEPAWLKDDINAASDPTPVIVNAALDQRADICTATLDLFVLVLASAVGNAALLLMPTGGIYLGGGIPPRILPRLQRQDFLATMHAKGRTRPLLERMPVHVILDAQSALHGAAWYARKAEADVLAEDAPR